MYHTAFGEFRSERNRSERSCLLARISSDGHAQHCALGHCASPMVVWVGRESVTPVVDMIVQWLKIPAVTRRSLR